MEDLDQKIEEVRRERRDTEKQHSSAQMVEEINKAVNGTLSITYYTKWDLYSYGVGTLLLNNRIEANSFAELIEKAYKIVKEESNGTK